MRRNGRGCWWCRGGVVKAGVIESGVLGRAMSGRKAVNMGVDEGAVTLGMVPDGGKTKGGAWLGRLSDEGVQARRAAGLRTPDRRGCDERGHGGR